MTNGAQDITRSPLGRMEARFLAKIIGDILYEGSRELYAKKEE
jgi:hypothetical protein